MPSTKGPKTLIRPLVTTITPDSTSSTSKKQDLPPRDSLESRGPPSSGRATGKTTPARGISTPGTSKRPSPQKTQSARPKPPPLTEAAQPPANLSPPTLQRSPFSPRFPRLKRLQAPLFTGPPKFKQARQGVLGDCWIMAPLAAIARTRPEFITDSLCAEVPLESVRIPESNQAPRPWTTPRIEEDDDDDYSDLESDYESDYESDSEDESDTGFDPGPPKRAFRVKLFSGHGQQRDVYVDAALPCPSGKLPFAHPGPREKAIWAAVVEKAVASNINPTAPTYKSIEKNAGIAGHQIFAGKARAHSRELYKQPRGDLHALLTRVITQHRFPATVTRLKPNSKRKAHREHELVVHSYKAKVLHLIDQRNGNKSSFTLTELCDGKKSGVRLRLLNWSELPLPTVAEEE